MAKRRQYVNLPAKELFVERGIDSIHRLGPVSFKVTLKKSDPVLVKFRAFKVSEVSPYTDGEKKRNFKYELQESIGSEICEDKEPKWLPEATLPPAGGAVYKFDACAFDINKDECKDKNVEASDQIEAWRRLFFQVFHMKGVRVPDLGPTVEYYKTLFIELFDHPDGEKTEILHLENASLGSLGWLISGKYTAQDREPWAMALVFAEQLPLMSEVKIGVDPHLGDVVLPARHFGNEVLSVELPEGMCLWWGIDPLDDARNDGTGIWLRGDGKLTVDGKDIDIPIDSISIDTSQSVRGGQGFYRLKIKLPEEGRNQNLIFDKSAQLTLKLWVLRGFAGGYTTLNENLLAVARRDWWKNAEYTESQKIQIVNHELGHKLGMVPKGGRRFGGTRELEAPDTLYGDVHLIYAGEDPRESLELELKANNNAKGHAGAHCERGAKGEKKGESWKWSGTPECVMFGSMGTANALTPQKFCAVCEKLLIRQNLDPRDPLDLPGFKRFTK